MLQQRPPIPPLPPSGATAAAGSALASLSSAVAMHAPPPPPTPRPPPLPDMGIILPPPDIRGIIDKTAQFVAKNGPEFEQRVLEDQANAHRFSFLLPTNPYLAYYTAKVKEFQTGEGK